MPVMKPIIGLLAICAGMGLLGCAQTDPASVCEHIARLQHGGANDRIKDYARRCKAPMTEAKLNRPAEYRCWSKCIVAVQAWPDSVRCDPCVGSLSDFELFQLSKSRKKQDTKPPASASASASSAPLEAGSCGADDVCAP